MFANLKNKIVTVNFEGEEINVRLGTVKEYLKFRALILSTEKDKDEEKAMNGIRELVLTHTDIKEQDLDQLPSAYIKDLFVVVSEAAFSENSIKKN